MGEFINGHNGHVYGSQEVSELYGVDIRDLLRPNKVSYACAVEGSCDNACFQVSGIPG